MDVHAIRQPTAVNNSDVLRHRSDNYLKVLKYCVFFLVSVNIASLYYVAFHVLYQQMHFMYNNSVKDLVRLNALDVCEQILCIRFVGIEEKEF